MSSFLREWHTPQVGKLMIVGLAMVVSSVLLCASSAVAGPVTVGAKVRGGGRYDNVRMCVATSAGTAGGPAMDVSFFTEFGLKDTVSIEANLPVVRPILFGLSYDMLQFEPEVTLLFRLPSEGSMDWVLGPRVGLSFHYGPDYTSGPDGAARGPSFFAMGPILGGYVGLDFKRPGKTFNFQIGLSPYVTPLFSFGDDGRNGIVVGGMLDAAFRFSLGR